jgi:hypothetical protein
LEARNRHAHAFILTREMGPEGLASTKLRKGIALVRKGGGSSFVAEGINWPDLTSEVLRTKLLECGSDITVDLIAPYPQTHLRPAGPGSQMSTEWRATQNKTANSYIIEITM